MLLLVDSIEQNLYKYSMFNESRKETKNMITIKKIQGAFKTLTLSLCILCKKIPFLLHIELDQKSPINTLKKFVFISVAPL